MLSPELREVLLHGLRNGYRDIVRYGGPATLIVQWRRHRQELLRPFFFWHHEMKLAQKPAGEHAELKLILEHGLARSEDEARFVERRLAEINRARPQPFRRVA